MRDPTENDPSLFEIMRTTRSMRRLKPDPVPNMLIRQILEAGTFAANGGNMQTWRFLVIRDPAIKQALAVYYKCAWHEIVGPLYRAGGRRLVPCRDVSLACSLRQSTWPNTCTKHRCGSCPACPEGRRRASVVPRSIRGR